MSEKRFVIFNADDFGASEKVNTAVSLAHTQGVLTSASLMVNEPGFAQAVSMAKELPELGVGLHLVVTHDRACLSQRQIPDLVDAHGKFGADPFKTGIKYAFSQKAQAQLQDEIAAQFDRFAETGIAWSHVDGHQHFHLPPVVWDVLIENCVRHNVFRLRVPREEIRLHRKQGGGYDLDTVASLIFRVLARRNLKKLKQIETKIGRRFFHPDRVYGHLQTGNMNSAYVQDLIERVKGDTNEIYLHPGATHARPLPETQRTKTGRDVELAALLSPDLKRNLETLGIRTGTYAQAESWRDELIRSLPLSEGGG